MSGGETVHGAGVLRIGVLGCASIAERRMLPSMLAQPLVEVVAIASRTRSKAEAFTARFGGHPVQGYEHLLAREDVDAVYLPLPPELHPEWTLRALAAGKHVLCEKPFALRLADTRKAVAFARERGLLVMESFMFLYHAQHATVRRLVADGAIGELQVFSAEFGIPLRLSSESGRPRHASRLPEVAAYPIRAAQVFLGEGLRVVGAQERTASAFGPRPAGTALLATPSGVAAQLAYGLEHSYRSGYTLWGSAGMLRLDRAFSTPDDHVPMVRLEQPDRSRKFRLKPDRQFRNIVGAFARTVLEAEDFTPHAEAILRHAELVDALERAVAAAAPPGLKRPRP